MIRFSRGYAVLRLQNAVRQVSLGQAQMARRVRQIRKILRFRKMDSLSARFVADFMNAKKLVLKHEPFNALAGWLDWMLQYKNEPEIPAGKQREVLLDSVKTALGRYLDAPLVTFAGGRFTVREMIRALRIRNVPFNQSSPRAMRKQLMADLKMIARDELLGREAYRRGLDRRPRVRFETAVWRDYYLSRLYAARHEIRLFPSAGGMADVQFPEPLQQLRRQAEVWINEPLLRTLEVPPIPVMAVRPGRLVMLVAPPWPN